jgi:hypothetical protein
MRDGRIEKEEQLTVDRSKMSPEEADKAEMLRKQKMTQ